jgi:hypothetical protein
MIRFIVVALAALAVAGSASAFDLLKITTNGTHLDGVSTGVSSGAVGAVVLPAGTTVTVR